MLRSAFSTTLGLDRLGSAKDTQPRRPFLTNHRHLQPSNDETWFDGDVYRIAAEVVLPGIGKSLTAALLECLASELLARKLKSTLRNCLQHAEDCAHRAKARELLAPVYGWFTEGIDTGCRAQAPRHWCIRRFLREVHGRRGSGLKEACSLREATMSHNLPFARLRLRPTAQQDFKFFLPPDKFQSPRLRAWPRSGSPQNTGVRLSRLAPAP
jgi:hypothetical protein